ncbi:alpha/beta hydrolase [soil metagenome]
MWSDGQVPTASVNGIEIEYQRSGEGERLLYLNGSGATLATTGMLLSPFTSKFDLLAHDQRGLGQTTVPPGPYSMADYAADALGLLDHVGWDRCRVVGISFGGMVAQELAVTAPERVDRLALLCTSPGGADLASYPLHELAELGPAQRELVATSIMDSRFTPDWLADPAHETDRLIADMMASRGRLPKSDEVRRGEAEQLQARRHHDVVDRLGRITCPTLVAAGRYDGIAPLANSEAIAERIPNAELRVYEGGHAFFGQDPKAIPDVIRWLAEA